MDVVRVGLVGLNQRARRLLLRGLAAAPHAQVTALCSRDPTKAAAVAAEVAPGAAICTRVDELARRDDVDAVYLNVPDELHCELAVAAIEGGKHVLCEKPLAQNVAQARQMTEAARRAGVRTVVNFTQRSQPAARVVRGVLDEGTLGDLHHVNLAVQQGARLGGSGPRKDALLDSGSHGIDLLHWWLDAPGTEPFSRVAAVFGPEDPERPPWWLCMLQTGSGAGVSLEVSKVVAGAWNVFTASFCGTRAAAHLYVDGGGGRVYITRTMAGSPRGEREEVPLPPELQISYEAFPSYHMERLVQAVRGEDAFATFEDGLRCQVVIEAATLAARERTWVDIPGLVG